MQEAPPPGARAHEARRSERLVWAVLGTVVIAAAVAAVAVVKPGLFARESPKPKAAVALEFLPNEVTRPARAAMPTRIAFSGPLVAPRTAIVRAKASGTLLALSVAEGQRVRAGQPVGQIDLADLTTRVADRSALVESAEANLAEANRLHANNVELAAQNFISATALQTSKAKLDAARAQLKSAEAQLAGSRVGVREASLVAPIAGIVGKRHVVAGEKVSAEQMLLTIVDLATLELAGAVGTHEVSLLQPGMPVEVQVEGQGAAVAGRIDRIAPQAEAGTRAIAVVVALDNRGERFRAGQYADAAVTVGDATERMTVPLAALGQASGQDFVWTIENGALVRRIVVTGRRDVAGGRVEITRGLADGAQLLALRFDALKEGAPARIFAARTPASGAASGPSSARDAGSAPVATSVRPAASASRS